MLPPTNCWQKYRIMSGSIEFQRGSCFFWQLRVHFRENRSPLIFFIIKLESRPSDTPTYLQLSCILCFSHFSSQRDGFDFSYDSIHTRSSIYQGTNLSLRRLRNTHWVLLAQAPHLILKLLSVVCASPACIKTPGRATGGARRTNIHHINLLWRRSEH